MDEAGGKRQVSRAIISLEEKARRRGIMAAAAAFSRQMMANLISAQSQPPSVGNDTSKTKDSCSSQKILSGKDTD